MTPDPAPDPSENRDLLLLALIPQPEAIWLVAYLADSNRGAPLRSPFALLAGAWVALWRRLVGGTPTLLAWFKVGKMPTLIAARKDVRAT